MESIIKSGIRRKLALTAAGLFLAVIGLSGVPATSAFADSQVEQPYDWMYSSDAVTDVHLELSQAQKTALNKPVKTEREWVGDVGFRIETADGHNFGSAQNPIAIEAKLKGGTSFRCFKDADLISSPGCQGKTGKPAFNLKLPKDGRPDGLKRMTLNSMTQDSSYIRESLFYSTFRKLDLPAAKSGYARLWVNGEYYGLFVNLEKYSDQFLDRWFTSTQHLYEGPWNVDFISKQFKKFEVDEGDEVDKQDLRDLIDAVATDDWSEVETHLAEPDRVIRFMAAEWYLGHWDGYTTSPNNFYAHSDSNGLFTMIPSGADQSFSTDQAFERGSLPNPNVLYLPLSDAVAEWKRSAILPKVCFADADCSNRFLNELLRVRRVAADMDFPARVDELSSALAPLIAVEPGNTRTAEYTKARQARTTNFMANQDATVKSLILDNFGNSLRLAPVILNSLPLETADSAASFEFGKDPAEISEVTGFECRLDQGEFESCSSPVTYQGLPHGEHNFTVRAVNEEDTPSPPATYEWSVAPITDHVVINEVNCSGVDWVELFNPTDAAVDVSGWVLTDDPLDRDPPRDSHRYTYPPSTVVPAGGFTTIDRDESRENGFEFGISCDDAISLGTLSGQLQDSILLDDENTGIEAFARMPDGGPQSVWQHPTRNLSNSTPELHVLTVNRPGDGSGEVTADPEPQGGGYTVGSLVALMAAPESNSVFEGWTGCDWVVDQTCMVSMDADRTVDAGFTLRRFHLEMDHGEVTLGDLRELPVASEGGQVASFDGIAFAGAEGRTGTDADTFDLEIPAGTAMLPAVSGEYGSVSFTAVGNHLGGTWTSNGKVTVQGPVRVDMSLNTDDGELSCSATTRLQLRTDQRALYDGARFVNGLDGPGALAAHWDEISNLRGDTGCADAGVGLTGPGGMQLTQTE